MKLEDIPAFYEVLIKDLDEGSLNVELYVKEAIENATSWEEAKQFIKNNLDGLIQEIKNVKENLDIK